MKSLRRRTALALLLLAAAVAATRPGAAQETEGAATTAPAGPEALSPRNANYTIEVTLFPDTKMLEGRQVVEWRNIQQEPTQELRFHLYWNGWRNSQSTWLTEDRLRGRSDRGEEIDDDDWSYCQVESIRLRARGERPDADLFPSFRYIWPDDGNSDDRTVFRVDLPYEVEPGESVEVELTWAAKIPRTFARTGFRGDFFFLAHWFPKLAVFESGGWSANQYHSATEYYSDYGVYDVSMTVPADWVVGATGREVERRDNGDGTATHRYVQEDVHAFSWTTSPDYVVLEDRFEEPNLPPVAMRLLIQPEHLKQADRHFAAAKAALKYYGSWFGPYPYEQVTFVDPAYGSGAGGMEYPTFFTCGTRLFNPFGGGRPEGVTIHEAGHQFWYGIVGNNEFDYAWIDEGLNSFSDARVLDVAFPDWYYTKRYFVPPGIDVERSGFFPVLFREIRKVREVDGNGLDRYRRTAVSDVQTTPTWRYHPGTAAGISYSKSAVWLHTLERHLGWETLRAILSTFFERWKFRHPTDEDFFAVAEEVADQDLSWFFDQVVREANTFDYAVDSVESLAIDSVGWFEEEGRPVLRPRESGERDKAQEGPEMTYRTEVVVRRLGSGVFPVEVLLVFEDGREVRHSWDGRSRWELFTEVGPSRLDYAVVDPERVLLLDENYLNNSRYRDSWDRWPAVKWASKWMIWFQDLLSAFTYFV
jgi:hypothetical protein